MIRTNRFTGISVLLISVLLLLSSCSDSGTGPDPDPDNDPDLTEKQVDVISYFKEIALGFEFGDSEDITRKWDRDILIYVGGEENQMLLDELNDIIDELNGLISADGVEISITPDSTGENNYYIFFGTGEDYEKIESNAQGLTDTNFGLFFVNWNVVTNHFVSGTMYVDMQRPEPQNQLHLLREELTQSLGLAQDSDRYDDSIFQVDYSTAVTEYSEYDKALIQLLYHPQMETGLSASQVDPVLREIVGEVIE